MKTEKICDTRILRNIFFRANTLELSFNYEKMQALGFCYSIIPALKLYYKDQPEMLKAALSRHMVLFNITPAMSPFVLGVSASLEKAKSRNPDMDENIINNIKTSLMGPLSGIGDSFFWGTFRIIAAGIGINLSQQGSLLGPLMFLLLFNIPNYLTRWFGVNLGFKIGTKLIAQISNNNIMDKITKIFGIVGLMCVGGMTATLIKINLNIKFSLSGAVVNIQEILDQILPNMLPVIVTLLCYKYIQKGISANKMLLIVILFGIAGKYAGIL